MKIGIDARLWNETGVGRYIRSLFQYLPTVDQENEYVWFFRKREFDTIKLPSSKWKKAEANIKWHSLEEQLILPAIYKKENVDLLHFPYFSFPILYKGKYIVTVHDLIFDHYKSGKTSTLPPIIYFIKKLGYHTVLRFIVKNAEKIITLSEASKREIIDHYHAPASKISITYESGSLEDKQRDFRSPKFDRIRNLSPFILYVGNAHPHKNVGMLIKAMKIIEKYDDKLKLVLIGSDQFFYPRLKANIEKEKIKKIEVIGEIQNHELAAWYHYAKGLVTASKMEGFGIPPLEAMSMGCLAFVSDIPVFHEVYGKGAIYFNQNDPQDIAQTILETLKNKILMEEKIKEGYKISKIYSWEKMVRETVIIYNKVLTRA